MFFIGKLFILIVHWTNYVDIQVLVDKHKRYGQNEHQEWNKVSSPFYNEHYQVEGGSSKDKPQHSIFDFILDEKVQIHFIKFMSLVEIENLKHFPAD